MSRATISEMNTADGDGQAELLEELTADAAHEAHGQKHRDDGEGGRHHREADLVRRVDGRLIAALAHAHVAHDVFDFDDGIVHQHAGHQRQPEQRDLIERETHPLHEGEGRYGRQRNGERRDQRGAHIAQEKPNDDDGQHRAFDQGLDRRMIGPHGVVHGGEDAADICTPDSRFDLVELGLSTAFATLTSEAPLALKTPKVVAGRPLSRAMVRTSAMPSCTSAISRRRTNLPPGSNDLRIAERLRRLGAAEHANRLLAAARPGRGRRRRPGSAAAVAR